MTHKITQNCSMGLPLELCLIPEAAVIPYTTAFPIWEARVDTGMNTATE